MRKLWMFVGLLAVNPELAFMTRELKAVIAAEENAVNQDEVYSRRALAEGYPGMGRLFHAVALSEFIQSENHKAALGVIGGRLRRVVLDPVRVSGTLENIGRAAAAESRMRLMLGSEGLERVRRSLQDVVYQAFVFSRAAGLEHEKLLAWGVGGVGDWDYYLSRISGKILLVRRGENSPGPVGFTDDYFLIR
ncbi:MAG: hypothetical protein HY074_02890 [Deltaproteobacteria bacterium]|nr:hypothetical protein [Deltaproteobacteria bacterium]